MLNWTCRKMRLLTRPKEFLCASIIQINLPFPPPDFPYLISPIYFPIFFSLRVALHSNDQPHGGLAMSLYLLSSLLLLLLHLSCCFIGCQLGCDINERSPLISITSVMPQPSFYPQEWMHSSKWHSKCHILEVFFLIIIYLFSSVVINGGVKHELNHIHLVDIT